MLTYADVCQLVNLCRLLDIPVVGPDSFLKYRLIERMRAIRADDRMIQAEGVESLSYYELREALAYRGTLTYAGVC